MTDHAEWMRIALAEAARAEERGEVPVGAVIVRDGVLLATGYNQPITQQDPTAHAEIMALRAACQREGNYRLPGVTLYVTLEPCMMCLGAMLHARVRCLVYGASDTRVGMASKMKQLSENSNLNHAIEVIGGVEEHAASQQLRAFFKQRR